MKKISSICFIIICFFSFTAQEAINQLDNKGAKTGKWIGRYPNSKSKRYEGFFRDDKPTGQFTYYAEKGYISAKVNFINDSISSSVMYYDDGMVMAKGKFINQLKVGKWSTYLKSGDLLNIYNYKNGILEGSQYMYYPENKESRKVALMEEYYCVKGLKDGVWKQYYELGSVKSKGQYKEGLKQGRFEYYFLNGKIDKKGRYIDDKKNGLWFFYDLDKDIMDEVIYKMGDVVKSKLKIDEGQ